MASNVDDEERAEIVKLIEAGETRNGIVRKTGRSAGTISTIAKEIDRPFDRSATKTATEVKAAWDQARRVELVGKGMAHAEKMLPSIAETRDLQAWMMAVGIAVDKLRLESGEATDIKESRRGGLDLESEFRKLDAEIRSEA